MSSCCVICYKDFAPGKRSAKLEAPEQKEWLENFLKLLQVPEEEWMNFENIDFGTQLPFCKNCFRLPKKVSQRYSSKEELEEELVALQEQVCEKVQELSTSIDKLNTSFRKVQEQVGQSENVEPKKMEVRRKRGRPKVRRLEDVGDGDDTSVVSVSASRREDGKFEELRGLILKWTPANQQKQKHHPTDPETSTNIHTQTRKRKLIENYPSNFIVPKIMNRDDASLSEDGEPTAIRVEDSLEEPAGIEVENSLEETAGIEVEDSVEEPAGIEVEDSVEEPAGIEVEDSVEEPAATEVDDSLEEPAANKVDDSLEEPAAIEVNDSLEEPAGIEVDDSLEEPAAIEVNDSLEEPAGIEVEDSVEEPAAIEVNDSLEEPAGIEVEDSVEEPAGIEIEISFEEPAVIEVEDSLEEPAAIEVEDSLEEPDAIGVENCLVEPSSRSECEKERQEDATNADMEYHSIGIRKDHSIRSRSLQDDSEDEEADKTDSDTMGGIMKEDLVSDGLSSSTLTSNKGRGVSRKRKAMDMIPSKAESTCGRDEPLDLVSESEDDICEADESYENEKCRVKKIIIEDTDKSADPLPLSLDEEQTALSYRHTKILGKYDRVDEKIMFNGIEIKKTEGHNYECGACGISKTCDLSDVFSIRRAGQFLRNHIQAEHLGGFICQWCIQDPEPFASNTFITFLHHIRSQHKVPEYECNVCGKPFMRKKNYFTHQQWSHKNEDEKADMITKRKDAMGKDTAYKQCHECSKIFATGNDLRRHSMIHSKENESNKLRIPCKYCGETYFAFTMIQHVKLAHEKSTAQLKDTATDIVPPKKQCPECCRNFARDKDLQRHHLKTHLKEFENNELRIPCQYCGEMYFPASISEHLKEVHNKSHQQCFSCKFCNTKFYSETVLERHIRRNHLNHPMGPMTEESALDNLKSHNSEGHAHEKLSVEPIEIDLTLNGDVVVEKSSNKISRARRVLYQCSLCPSNFAVQDRLTRHLRTVHSEEIGSDIVYFYCKLCNSRFLRRDKLSRHLKMVHAGFQKPDPPTTTPTPAK